MNNSDNSNTNPSRLHVWQWTCRGFRNKKSLLSQFIDQAVDKPDVILLQETGCTLAISGYTTFIIDDAHILTTLIRKDIAAQTQLAQASDDVHYLTVELITPVSHKQRDQHTVYMTNIYSPPRARQVNFKPVLTQRPTWRFIPLVAGDINATHTAWGYPTCSSKGRQLYTLIHQGASHY